MKTIGIYPGRFQPAHRGHLGVYNRLKQISNEDTFIATSDKTPTPDSPLNFQEKQQIWQKHGVPITHVIRVKNVYSPVEITNKFMDTSTSAVFALGSRDVERFGTRRGKDPETGMDVWMKADGKTPQYFQPYKGNEKNMKPLKEHGYVMVVDDIKIDGKPISGTNIRDTLASAKLTKEQKVAFFKWALGWYDPTLFQVMTEMFSKAVNAVPAVEKMPSMASMIKKPVQAQPQRKISKSGLQNVVAEILDELIAPQGGSVTPDQTSSEHQSTSTIKTTDTPSQSDLNQQKKEAEAEAKKNRELAKGYETQVRNYKTYQKKNDRDKIDGINKQRALATKNPISPTSPIP